MVDLVFLLFSVEQHEIQESGTRILLCIESLDVLSRLLPTPELRERVECAAEVYAGAEVLRFTNAHGTDVTYQLGTYPVITEYGYTDEPGRWDHWPSGFLFSGGRDDGVDGRVVIAPGDIVYPFNRYVESPIDLTVESGRIVDIRGGLDADLMADYMAGFDDEKAYGISHIGWGLNERCRWSALATDPRSVGMEGRAFYGNVLFSTGPNQELGGSTTPPATSTSPCATAPSTSTTSPSWSTAMSSPRRCAPAPTPSNRAAARRPDWARWSWRPMWPASRGLRGRAGPTLSAESGVQDCTSDRGG